MYANDLLLQMLGHSSFNEIIEAMIGARPVLRYGMKQRFLDEERMARTRTEAVDGSQRESKTTMCHTRETGNMD